MTKIPNGSRPVACVVCGTCTNIVKQTNPVSEDGSPHPEFRKKGLCITHARRFDKPTRSEELCDRDVKQFLKKSKNWTERSVKDPRHIHGLETR